MPKLKDITYETPSGRKLVAKGPVYLPDAISINEKDFDQVMDNVINHKVSMSTKGGPNG